MHARLLAVVAAAAASFALWASPNAFAAAAVVSIALAVCVALLATRHAHAAPIVVRSSYAQKPKSQSFQRQTLPLEILLERPRR